MKIQAFFTRGNRFFYTVICLVLVLVPARRGNAGETEAAVRDEWSIVYEAEQGKPGPAWSKDRGSERTATELAGGSLLIADRGEEDGDYLYYRYSWEAAPGGKTVVEARAKVKSGWSALIVDNGVYAERLVLLENRIELWSAGEYASEIDAAGEFRTYRVEAQGEDIMVYVDGELHIDGKGVYRRPSGRPGQGQAAFGAANSGGLGEAYWKEVKVSAQAKETVYREGPGESKSLRIISRDRLPEGHPGACLYAEPGGRRMVSRSHRMVSDDNGKTWRSHSPEPDFTAELPYGYRRYPCSSVVDPNTGKFITIVNTMDTPGLDPAAIEPPISMYTYYLRYRVSADGVRTWLFEEPVVEEGFTGENPFEGVHIGKNSVFLGDAGNVPIVTRGGEIIIPAQTPRLDREGELFKPYGTPFYEVLIISGRWDVKGRLAWTSSRIKIDHGKSTRGLIEPTLAEFPDGRILAVMRGSNAGRTDLPGYKWYSVSEDGGIGWSVPRPWTYEDGSRFYSPSSMSHLVRHSSGRVFWIGNISDANPSGNNPRYPAVMGEVCPGSLMLKGDSVIFIDTRRAEDADRGRLDISHFSVYEDRDSNELVVTYPRAYHGYRERESYIARVGIKQPGE